MNFYRVSVSFAYFLTTLGTRYQVGDFTMNVVFKLLSKLALSPARRGAPSVMTRRRKLPSSLRLVRT